jgi:hypothetical protein
MARPKKLPTKVVRINAVTIFNMKKKAKKKKMSLPDYLDWRLSK